MFTSDPQYTKFSYKQVEQLKFEKVISEKENFVKKNEISDNIYPNNKTIYKQSDIKEKTNQPFLIQQSSMPTFPSKDCLDQTIDIKIANSKTIKLCFNNNKNIIRASIVNRYNVQDINLQDELKNQIFKVTKTLKQSLIQLQNKQIMQHIKKILVQNKNLLIGGGACICQQNHDEHEIKDPDQHGAQYHHYEQQLKMRAVPVPERINQENPEKGSKLEINEKNSKMELNEKESIQELNVERDPTKQYLSSNNLDIIKNEKQNIVIEEINESFSDEIKKRLYFMIAYIINYAIFAVIPFHIILMALCTITVELCSGNLKRALPFIWGEICCISFIYSLITFIYYPIENEIMRYFQFDCIFFYFTSVLVFSYLKTTYCNRNACSDIIQDVWDDKNISTFLYISQSNSDSQAYFMDYNQKDFKDVNFEQVMISRGYSKIPCNFSYFLDHVGEENKLTQHINDHFNVFKKYMDPSFKSFYFLSGIVLLKILFSFFYIFLQVDDISKNQYFDLITTIFLYIYTTFNLNRILGNNDLRRKHIFMVEQNEFINFKNIQSQNLHKKLDIICPISLESWDNKRNFILSYKNEWIETLELSYFCLFLYFIIVTLVCLTYYFELYWIFEKESILLNPIIVIMSSFNFIFLSAFFLIRFYEGNKFNDTFEDQDNSLFFLIDTIEDLESMFDTYFNHKKKEVRLQEEKNSIYGILVNKIKLLSNYYIKKGDEFHGRKYNENEKSQLRKDILLNAKLSLQKVKSSLNQDSNQYKYKFLNLIEVNFKDTFITLLFALVTTLPTIVPKFIEFIYK